MKFSKIALITIIILLFLLGIAFYVSRYYPNLTRDDVADETALVPEVVDVFVDGPSVVDVALGIQEASTFVNALQNANLLSSLRGGGPFTVFIPTYAAFRELPEELFPLVVQDEVQAIVLTTYHIVPGRFTANDLFDTATLTTVGDSELAVTFVEGELFINNAKVLTKDINASNGVIHIIDTVLIQEQEQEQE